MVRKRSPVRSRVLAPRWYHRHMSLEQMPSGPESIDRTRVVEILKAKGFEDPESREIMIAWSEKREAEVSAEGTREAQVNFEIERAEIYRDAGNIEYAAGAYEDALMI